MLSISHLLQWKPEYLEKLHFRQSKEQTTLAWPNSSTYSVYSIDIKSHQNRLLKVCYVPASSASLNRLLFFSFCCDR
jgi:hypothetical protein